jgi:uncharacterized paraquat-inducible protein A
MINKLTDFQCTGCDAEFGVIPHTDFEEDDVAYCVLCGEQVQSDSDLDLYADFDEDGD